MPTEGTARLSEGLSAWQISSVSVTKTGVWEGSALHPWSPRSGRRRRFELADGAFPEDVVLRTLRDWT